MQLTTLDWSFIIGFFVLSLIIGLIASKQSSKSYSEYFLSGRNMPWWLLGISMVATTFSADTPNLVTDIVRKNGVAGNWVWWAFLLTGMLTVFVYARLWRRSGISTDLEFYELRYSGKPAAFLRGFRAIYLGVFFNVMIMATVCLAAIKIGGVLLGLSPTETLLISSVVTLIYTVLGGLRGVIWTDFFQFILAMIGTVWAAIVIIKIPEVNGLQNLLAHEAVTEKLDFLPDFNDLDIVIPLLIIPLAVQWWSVWYPGAEPGGGGYIAQRMLSAKDEKNAVGATLLFNIAHYALRPWPWILIALASLVVFPMQNINTNQSDLIIAEGAVETLKNNESLIDINMLKSGIDGKLENTDSEETKANLNRLKSVVEANPNHIQIRSLAYIFSKNKDMDSEKWSNPLDDELLVPLQLANPTIDVSKLGHDLAYPAMLGYLPKGLLGLVLASLIGAFMSTISTHLNWGSSYIANDFYKRFWNRRATDSDLIVVGRISTVFLMIIAALFALQLENALQAFNILLQIGAGTGLIFILRWFWWRINAWSEVSAMIISFAMALFFEFGYSGDMLAWQKLLAGIGITTLGWLIVTFMTQPTEHSKLVSFYKLIKPHSGGWQKVVAKGIHEGTLKNEHVTAGKLPTEILCMFLGVFLVYGILFGTGFFIYGNTSFGFLALGIAILSGLGIIKFWKSIE